jgi:uncharacterized protein YutE (UPF0331/DUF86 family)
MRLDIYQAETERLAREQSALLDEAKHKLQTEHRLKPLEQAGVLHALQVLIENAIGKAKHLLKAAAEPVPVLAYDAFASLACIGITRQEDLPGWNATIGIHNRIVHEYMNIDMAIILDLVSSGRYQFVTEFLFRAIA